MPEDCFSIFKKAVEDCKLAPNPYCYAAAKEVIEEDETKRREQLDQMNKEWRVNNTSYSIDDLEKELQALEERKNELKKLAEDIDNQPVINLNGVDKRTRSKEGKLPKKLRAGWK